MRGDTCIERWSGEPTGGIVDVFASITMAAEFGVNVGSAIVNSSLFKAPTHSNPYESPPVPSNESIGFRYVECENRDDNFSICVCWIAKNVADA